jgi:hypothetical protein
MATTVFVTIYYWHHGLLPDNSFYPDFVPEVLQLNITATDNTYTLFIISSSLIFNDFKRFYFFVSLNNFNKISC